MLTKTDTGSFNPYIYSFYHIQEVGIGEPLEACGLASMTHTVSKSRDSLSNKEKVKTNRLSHSANTHTYTHTQSMPNYTTAKF